MASRRGGDGACENVSGRAAPYASLSVVCASERARQGNGGEGSLLLLLLGFPPTPFPSSSLLLIAW